MINQNLLLTGDAGYNLTKSLRFRSSASASLSRTPASASNRTTWTWSAWVKRAEITTTERTFFSAGTDGNNFTALAWINDSLYLQNYTSGTQTVTNTTAVFRDPSAWYHIVLAIDTTQATAANRAKIYVNGVQQAGFSGTPFSSSQQFWINFTYGHRIGSRQLSSADSFSEQYMTEINFIDGQVLTPSSFGETSTTTGVWIPKKYTGTYGTNGFYLPFTDTTSTSTLGTDFSGNSNTWTVNNISLTSGSTYDSMTDVPTLTSATTANYCTLNAALQAGGYTLNDGNLNWARTGATGGTNDRSQFGTIGVTSGKWYWEFTAGTVNSNSIPGFGIAIGSASTQSWGGSQTGVYIYESDGLKYLSGTGSSYGATFTTGDIIGVAFDADAGTLTFYKNNTSQGQATSGLTTGNYCFGVTAYQHPTLGTSTYNANFGQRPFAYTPPTGFVELNTFNLPTPTIGATASSQANKYMDVTLWTGDGTTNTRSFTNSGSMQPDWIWTKARSATWAHNIFDSVRGFANDKGLNSNLTDAEGTNRNGYVSAANSNGFSMANGTSGNQYYNENGTTYVGWQWRASNATAVTNTAGSITSTVSANTTAGFSIVTWTGTGANATVGHGLGVAPSMIIIKNRSTVTDWPVYHGSNTTSPATQRVLLNTTDATATSSTYWNNTAPTSSVFSISTYSGVNGNTNAMVAYCFAQVAGYSAFGSYTGNGSTDGTFVYTGFRPRFILIKASSFSTASTVWTLFDTSRNPYNAAVNELYANLSSAEGVDSSGIDILSNGFKPKRNSEYANSNGQTYIYMAFAEVPYKYSLGR